jgi:hypothetical protein
MVLTKLNAACVQAYQSTDGTDFLRDVTRDDTVRCREPSLMQHRLCREWAWGPRFGTRREAAPRIEAVEGGAVTAGDDH